MMDPTDTNSSESIPNPFESLTLEDPKEAWGCIIRKHYQKTPPCQALAKKAFLSKYPKETKSFKYYWDEAWKKPKEAPLPDLLLSLDTESIEPSDQPLNPQLDRITYRFDYSDYFYLEMYLSPNPQDKQGIYGYDIKYHDDSKEETGDIHFLSWKSLLGIYKYKLEINQNPEWRYSFRLDGIPYYDKPLSEVLAILYNECYHSDRAYALCKNLIQQWVNDPVCFPDQTDRYSAVIGFCESGWKLPPEGIFQLGDSESQAIFRNITKTLTKTWDYDQIKKTMQQIYEYTGIQYKEIIFAWGIAAPFFHGLKSYLKYFPHMGLGGTGDRGKSPMSVLITHKWYGHNDKDCFGYSNSLSQIEGIYASSAFPYAMDDQQDYPDEAKNSLKTYNTNLVMFQKKGGGLSKQLYTIMKPMCCPLIFTYNADLSMFQDPAVRERFILLKIKNLVPHPKWIETVNSLPDGAVLALLYNHTKNWTAKTIWEKMQPIREMLSKYQSLFHTKDRDEKQALLILFGQQLFKELFDIDLHIDFIRNILPILDENYQLIDEGLFDAIDTLIKYGQYRPKTDTLPNQNLDDFIPKDRTYFPWESPKDLCWIRTPLTKVIKDSANGYAFTRENITDIQISLHGYVKNKWSLDDFVIKVQRHYPNAIKTRGYRYILQKNEAGDLIQKTESNPTSIIFIPLSDFKEEELPINPEEEIL